MQESSCPVSKAEAEGNWGGIEAAPWWIRSDSLGCWSISKREEHSSGWRITGRENSLRKAMGRSAWFGESFPSCVQGDPDQAVHLKAVGKAWKYQATDWGPDSVVQGELWKSWVERIVYPAKDSNRRLCGDWLRGRNAKREGREEAAVWT